MIAVPWMLKYLLEVRVADRTYFILSHCNFTRKIDVMKPDQQY